MCFKTELLIFTNKTKQIKQLLLKSFCLKLVLFGLEFGSKNVMLEIRGY